MYRAGHHAIAQGRAQSTEEHNAQCTMHNAHGKTQSTKHRAQSTMHRAEHRAQSGELAQREKQ